MNRDVEGRSRGDRGEIEGDEGCIYRSIQLI